MLPLLVLLAMALREAREGSGLAFSLSLWGKVRPWTRRLRTRCPGAYEPPAPNGRDSDVSRVGEDSGRWTVVGGLGSDVVVEIESPELMIGFASWVIQKIGIQS